MDLKEYFRETDGKPRWVQHKIRGQGTAWQHHQLLNYTKPTIAMVNGRASAARSSPWYPATS